jgi:hypothetical protein
MSTTASTDPMPGSPVRSRVGGQTRCAATQDCRGCTWPPGRQWMLTSVVTVGGLRVPQGWAAWCLSEAEAL